MKAFLDSSLKTLGRKELAIVLRSVLDRYPVIIHGDSPEILDSIAEALVKFVPHRKEVVFGSDFVSYSEHERMKSHEKSDYNGERIVYRSPTSATQLLCSQIKDYQGWIVASDQNNFDELKRNLAESSLSPIIIRFEEGTVKLESNGSSKTIANTRFEEKLLEKVTSETGAKIERITRILRRAAHGKVSERLEKNLIDLKHEEERVRLSLFKEHIQGFVEAAWRVMVILMRLRLLEGVGVKSGISDKMLTQAIDYKGSSINRLLDFVKAEWGEDFQSSVQEGAGHQFGDRLEGFWSI
jgi:hypothetical protein